ncbi:DNA mismatch repair protein MutS [Paenibacillus sp. GYB004]|uniref:endonuclease MutS2 n=1 Tax=Paenibacillus sp. GYB004 TaxID=2994393 RepID=UPI002F96305B
MNHYALQRLEYEKVTNRVADYAVSYLGKRHVEALRPMTELKTVRTALDETAEALTVLNNGASVPIPSLSGIETVLQLSGTGYVFSEQDFTNIRLFLQGCEQLQTYMAAKSSVAPRIAGYAESMHELSGLKREIDRCIRNGQVDDGASRDLLKARRKIAAVSEKIKTRMDALMSRHRSIMQENLFSVRSGRYVLPIKKEHRKLVSGSVLDESSSGQTVYIEPQEIAHLQHELAGLRAEEAKEEEKVLAHLTGLVEEADYELKLNVETIGTYDFLFAKAKFALSVNGRNVGLNDSGVIRLRNAVHPLLGGGTVPLNFTIGRSHSSLVITGPNTGGKTIALKTVGLLTLMAQSGLLVPADEGSELAVFRHVAADIGDGQSIEQSLSTFSAHIRNMVGILDIADGSTLVLLDELASGTDPGEGVGLSIAILEALHERGATVVATTHFNEIKHFASRTRGFQNARMEFDAETLQPLYRLRIGEAGQSYAFLIAKKLGISADIISRSEQLTQARGGGGADFAEGDGHAEPDCPHSPELEQVLNPESAQVRPEEPQEPSREERRDRRMTSGERQEVSGAGQPSGEAERSEAADADKKLEIGDCVFISYLGKTGIVCEAEDARGNVGVMIQKQRFKINRKRLALHIAKSELYPDNYDMDIVFESKEDRKKRKLMSRKHVEGLTIVKKPESDG